jgi:O-antigen/teichoic acid export membrane protein
MLVSLYTVRVVLNTLGAEDYGIYSVVAGAVTMFGLLTGSMANATQRYFSFEIGRENFERLRRIFSISLMIYVLIALIVLLLGETLGLWLVQHKLIIPPERKNAALWVYHFSVISFLFTILTAPYMAVITAHEDMNIYAYVSIADVILNLGAVFLLQFILLDKLQLYGILMCSVKCVTTAVYRTICVKKYRECKFRLYWDKHLFKELASFAGWNIFGASSGIFKLHAVNILLNQFFNPIVVAARGISSQVNTAASSLAHNFFTAIRPQIIKVYAAEERERMFRLMYGGVKAIFFLMYLFILPMVLETPAILYLWLKNPPDYSVWFIRLTLIDTLIESTSNPITAAAHATGKIKLFYFLLSGILLLNLPCSWIVLKMGCSAYSVMIARIILTATAFIVRLLLLKRLIALSIMNFFAKVLLPLFFVSVISLILPLILSMFLYESFLRLCMVCAASVISVCLCMYFVGLNNTERQIIVALWKRHIYRRFKH